MATLRKAVEEGQDCNGMGCCSVDFPWPVRSFRLSINQKEEAAPKALANATVKAFLQDDENEYDFSMLDLLSDKVNESTIGASSTYLSPVITDQPNCRKAMKHEQYACAASSCVDYYGGNGGYACACYNDVDDLNYNGNPYLADGCTEGT